MSTNWWGTPEGTIMKSPFLNVCRTPPSMPGPARFEPVRVGVLGDRPPGNELHREPGRTVRERVGVVEPGDGRMVELGEDPLFLQEPLPPFR